MEFISKDVITNIAAITDMSQLADTVSAHFNFKLQDKQELLETVSPIERMTLLLELMQAEIEIYRMEQRIKGRVKKPCLFVSAGGAFCYTSQLLKSGDFCDLKEIPENS